MTRAKLNKLIEEAAEDYAVSNEQATLNIERLKVAVKYGAQFGLRLGRKDAIDLLISEEAIKLSVARIYARKEPMHQSNWADWLENKWKGKND